MICQNINVPHIPNRVPYFNQSNVTRFYNRIVYSLYVIKKINVGCQCPFNLLWVHFLHRDYGSSLRPVLMLFCLFFKCFVFRYYMFYECKYFFYFHKSNNRKTLQKKLFEWHAHTMYLLPILFMAYFYPDIHLKLISYLCFQMFFLLQNRSDDMG